jgi:flagellar motor switch protein FliM
MADEKKETKPKTSEGVGLLIGAKMEERRFPLVENVFKNAAHALLKQFNTLITDADIEVSCLEVKSNYCESHLEPFFKDPLMCATFEAKAWDGRGILVSDLGTLFKLVKRMLGSSEDGEGKEAAKSSKKENAPSKPGEEMTSVEAHLCRTVFKAIAKALEMSFEGIAPSEFIFEKAEIKTKSDFFLYPRPSLVGVFNIKVQDHNSHFHVVLPYTMLQSVTILMSEDYLGDDMGEDKLWKSHVNREIRGASVPLKAVLSVLNVPLKSMMKWTVGKTLVLEETPESVIDVKCDDRVLFTAKIGQKKGLLALSVEDLFLSKGGQK